MGSAVTRASSVGFSSLLLSACSFGTPGSSHSTSIHRPQAVLWMQ